MNPSVDDLARSVTLAVGDRELDIKGKRSKPLRILERPVQTLVILAGAKYADLENIPIS